MHNYTRSMTEREPGDNGATIDVEAFAGQFLRFLEAMHELRPPGDQTLGRMVGDHLGVNPQDVAPVGQNLPAVERPNLQLAMDHIMAEQPDAKLIGLSPQLIHWGEFSFAMLLGGRFRGPSEPMSPSYDEHPVDVDESLRCVLMGVWLIRHEGTPVAVCLSPGERHGPPDQRSPRIEVFAPNEAVATALLDHLEDLRHRFNVYRGKVLAFNFDEFGDFGINFVERPHTTADEVILPPATLWSIERHAVDIATRAEPLVALGQHLKRGMLLYGPPGTGKTHTVGYLANAMPERTVVVLQGPSLGALGQAAAIVRSLTPAMLVIEDVDIIAAERGLYDAHGNPLLFQLLNEMDGLNPISDVLFVLTTNRPDVLEPALAARPGRIDHAVEINLPGPDERRRLLELYLRPASHEIADLEAIVDRLDGVTASFVKELVRRATMGALNANPVPGTDVVLTDTELNHALDELLDNPLSVSRAVFGIGDSPTTG